jgi:hypothetical protein
VTEALLLDACRVGLASASQGAEAARDHSSDRDSPTDWEWLLAAAERHAVSPLLTRYLADSPEGVPAPVLARLRARFDANALRNVTLAHDLAALLERLAAAGVDAMPIKGPVLAISAYGDLALREFGDLDIVVRAADLARARELFAAWGFEPATPLTTAGERALLASDHHIPLVGPGARLTVELHWSLDNLRPGSRLDGEWVWANARRVPLLGREVSALSWSALLVYLCVHGAKHGWSTLGWIRDVAGVLASAPPGELDTASAIASAVGAERRLALGVWLAHELLGAPRRLELPGGDHRAVTALARDVRENLFHGESARGPGRIESLLFQCRTLDRVRDRAGFALHLIAAPHVADVAFVRLPERAGWLYGVIRVPRLVAKSVTSLARPRLPRER